MDYFDKSNWSKNIGLRYLLGLTASLSLTLTAFEWKSYESEAVVTLTCGLEQIMDIPNNYCPPLPPLPTLINPEIIEIEDDEKDDLEEVIAIFNAEFKLEDIVVSPPIIVIKKISEEIEDEPFVVVEEQAEPESGLESFFKFVEKNIRYPLQVIQAGIEGKVYVEFVVEQDGSITNIKVVKGIGAGCDEEAERVISLSPKWKPAKQRGRPVRQRIVIPIVFHLN